MSVYRRWKSMRKALLLIAGARCERFTGGGWRCITEPGLTPDCYYLADRWCDACTARAGLCDAFPPERSS